MHKYRTLALLLCVAAVAACDKNGRQDITAPVTGANIKFFNFAVNAPGVNFYDNTQKVTAISSTTCQTTTDTLTLRLCNTNGVESTTGTGYGAAGAGGLYISVPPGSAALAGKIAAATDNGLAISNVAATLEAGKYYSYFLSGVYDASGKKADAFVVEDVLPTPDYTNAYVRFVNAASNSQPMVLYAKSSVTGTETAIGTAVAYKNAGTFTAVPGAVYDLNLRTAGSSTNLVTRTAVSFSAGHVYTVTVRGDMISTVAAAKPALDNTANR